MTSTNDLVRKAESIITYISDQGLFRQPSVPEDILPVIHGLHQLFPQWVTMVCPFHHPNWYYVSENAESVFGYASDFMTKQMSPNNFFDQIHEADIDDLYHCLSYVNEFLKDAAPADYHKFRFVFHYRFLRKDGRYVWLHDEKATYQTKNNSLLYYSLYRDLSQETVFRGVTLNIYKLETELKKIGSHKPSATRKLSMRESQLIGLIQKGFTTKEIAHQLSISHHTVRNLRSRMFEKFKVSNVIELLNMAG